MQSTDTLTTFRKLKLRTMQYFVDSLTGDMNELEKVFLPARFLANASKHISISIWNRLIFKGQSEIEKSLLPTAKEKHRAPLTNPFQMENSMHLNTRNIKNYQFNIRFLSMFTANRKNDQSKAINEVQKMKILNDRTMKGPALRGLLVL